MSTHTQEQLFPDVGFFPKTRYQGSKRKLVPAILEHLLDLRFTTVLDAFGGTAAMAHAFKCAGKEVTYNDLLAFNHQIGLALIENDAVRLEGGDIESLCTPQPTVTYPDFIEETFEGIYFTTEENRWLDMAVANVRRLTCPYQRAIAWFALFQSAMAKRPYNLFHRCNLYMRTAEVKRGFGNKASWDRSFADHFKKFAAEANAALVNTSEPCRATCRDVLDIEPGFDLVYIDPPYINSSGVGVDYRDFYHFLEGMVRYDDWPALVDRRSKHRRLLRHQDPWSDPARSSDVFRLLFERMRDSILVVSYRSDGIPSVKELAAMLGKVKRRVGVIAGNRYQYVLSTKRSTHEVLLIGTD